MKVYAALLSAGSLAACATPDLPPPIEIKVPVPVPCVSAQLPGPPDYPDTAAALRAAPDLAEFTRLLAAGWPLREARLKALEAAIEPCRKTSP
ncbi:MAG: hypothetical protein IM667_11405 [Phenylobacterium sp.]|uniref:hypothetical protein n=1 Tax=Phenylobacterium sp. TaxID=1871053 RepID=UPI0025FC7F73|nr:hypothetical protein [Phenylobacterium sp.]MCA3713107.1 hypothetical protein [Phenylobacterium sp.]MCA6237293.1 hypothetical protein [Phenylobacterium sp.]MCA6241236.1 hypothetical protein [Phenylobacterium sp.]